jgi:hypothetical protein
MNFINRALGAYHVNSRTVRKNPPDVRSLNSAAHYFQPTTPITRYSTIGQNEHQR